MSPRLVLALSSLLALVLASDALANGRSPGTSTISFRRGMEQEVVAGMTFGLVRSLDGGATWHWMCEDAIGYGGTYDPDYMYTSTGALFATTFDGLKVMRDGCTFASPYGRKFVSVTAQGPDGRLYHASSDTPSAGNPGDSGIYRSDDDGVTWPVSSMPGVLNDWWQSLEVAPSDADRLYLSGYRFISGPGGNMKTFLLFRSDNAGQSWQPLPTGQIATMPNSTIEIAGISHANPNLVFARVKLEDNAVADAIYRSDDGGMTWKKILGKGSALAFVVRRSGELVAATQAQGAVRSGDNGETWTDLAAAPHINCLAENSAGEVWACTQNYGGMQAPSDGYGIMKSTDLATWAPVLKYQEMKAPIACADGTVQKDRCDNELWCGLCSQLGCETGRPECEVGGDGAGDGDTDKGCCKNSATPAPGALLIVLGVGALLLRPRRGRRPR
ncbi:MAG TPA: sialidase family protein [Kofleriaceae bacterium]|nr:sialidase family protein [Kofleriaceae bacterium]